MNASIFSTELQASITKCYPNHSILYTYVSPLFQLILLLLENNFQNAFVDFCISLRENKGVLTCLLYISVIQHLYTTKPLLIHTGYNVVNVFSAITFYPRQCLPLEQEWAKLKTSLISQSADWFDWQEEEVERRKVGDKRKIQVKNINVDSQLLTFCATVDWGLLFTSIIYQYSV